MSEAASCIIDWMTFSVPCASDIGFESALPNEVADDVIRFIPELELGKDVIEIRGAGIHPRGIHNGRGTHVSFGGNTNYHISLSGQACEEIRKTGKMAEILSKYQSFFSRIDVAVDVHTNRMPAEFVANFIGDSRFKSKIVFDTPTGQTYYIGSLKSDRYMRVYRYSPPHPRSDYLRVEFINRRHYALLIARLLCESEINNVAQSLIDCYGIDLDVNGQSLDISYPNFGSTDQKTLWWLCKQVAPAIRRLVKSGVIADLDTFVEMYFKNTPQL